MGNNQGEVLTWDPHDSTQVLLATLHRVFSRPNGILLDFPPGANGNFLEYIINRFIFSVEAPDNPFTDLYTVKCAAFPPEYHRARRCIGMHWSALRFNYSLDPSAKLIRISVPTDDYEARMIHRINHVYRVTDVPFSTYPDEIKNQKHQLRERLHYEFNLLAQSLPWNPHPGPTLEVNFKDFYDRDRFADMIKTIAVFAEKDVPDPEIYLSYHQTFVDNNHGWLFYQRALQYINQNIYANAAPMDLNLVEQAVVLALCTKDYQQANPNKVNPLNHIHRLMDEFDSDLIRQVLFS